MKKLVFVGLAIIGCAFEAFPQGAIFVDSTISTNGVALGTAGEWYSGTFGIEIWELNARAVPSGINSATNVIAYNQLRASGFELVTNWLGQSMEEGTVAFDDELEVPGVTPAGGEAVFALAIWTGPYADWTAAVSAGANGGVLALVNATGNYRLHPAPIPPDLSGAWDALGMDLVMTPLAAPPSTPPLLGSLANRTVFANTTLTFVATATDSNLPSQTITFTLGPGAPSGAAITANGVFTWTPATEQAPSNYSISIIATDSGVPPLSATNSFSVLVYPPNTPPALPVIADRTIFANTRLTFPVSATDTDQPPQVITYTLGNGAPSGAAISADGIFTWTPTADQAPSTNSITVVATDNGVPPLSASSSFSVVVQPLTGPESIIELDNSDATEGVSVDLAQNWFSGIFGLEVWELNGTSVPGQINSATNVIAYEQLAANGFHLVGTWIGQSMAGDPGAFSLGEIVVPGVNPPGSQAVLALAAWTGLYSNWSAAVAAGSKGGVVAFVNSTVNPLVQGPPPVPPDLAAGWNSLGQDLVMTPLAPLPPANTPPVLPVIANRSIFADTRLTFSVSATDTDQPPQTITYTLGAGAPWGAAITTEGVFSWTPTTDQAPSTNSITVVATDNGTPPLSATASFTVLVQPLTGPESVLDLDNSASTNGVSMDLAHNWFSGIFGLEVWALDGTAVPSAINSATNVVAYTQLAANGFNLVATWIGQTMASDPGGFSLGEIVLPEVNPPGSQAVLALAAWTGMYSNWSAAVAAGSEGGVVAFVNETVNPMVQGPPPVPPDLAAGWNGLGKDLIMTPLTPLPNSPPVLAAIANQTVVANTLLTLTASAADPNQPPQTINYVLGPGAPSGAAITTNGVFTWTPTAAQAPNTYSISVIAIDSSVPPLSATNSFSVVVYSPNTPPVLIGIANRSIFADTRLTFIASATDTDQPPQTISYALGPGAPFGAEITTNGIFSWTPTADQAPSTNSITVVATDNGMPPLSATNSFLVAVQPLAGPESIIDLDNTDANNGVALDRADHWFSGMFGLEVWQLNGTAVPAGINSATNVIAYNELTANGFSLVGSWIGQTMAADPGVLSLGEIVVPGINPPGSEAVFALAAWTGMYSNWSAAVASGAEGGVVAFVNPTVNPMVQGPPPIPPDLATGWNSLNQDLIMTPLGPLPNTAPVIAAIPNQTIQPNSTLSFTAVATDTDKPAQTLTFSLGPGSPTGAAISANGQFNWTPTLEQASSTNPVTVIVTDSGVPPLSSSQSFTVIVSAQMTLTGLAQDGYIAGATVFLDTNLNGVLDPGEPFTTTDSTGHFSLGVDLSKFDPSKCRLVLTNGLDIATGLPLGALLTAPVGSTVVNPLTTLMQAVIEQNPGMGTTQAQAMVQTALGLSNTVDLTQYDPVAASATNDPSAGPVLSAAAAVQDTVVQISALVSGSANSPSASQAAATVMAAMAVSAQTNGALNLSQSGAVSDLINQVLASSGSILPTNVAGGAAAVISGGNQQNQAVLNSALDGAQAAQGIAQMQGLAQGVVAQSLQDAAAGAQGIDDVVVGYTGAALSQAASNAPVGNVTGTVQVQPGTFAFGAGTFRVNQDGTPVPGFQVTVIRSQGNQGGVTAIAALSAGTGTIGGRDFVPGTIQVPFGDQEISKTIDLRGWILNNASLAPGATIRLTLSLANGASEGARLGALINADVELVNATKPGTFGFSASQYSIQNDGTPVLPVVVTRTGGSGGAVTAIVTPVAIAGGAIPGRDFATTPIQLTFEDGNMNRLVTVPILASRASRPGPFGLQLSVATNNSGGAALGSVRQALVVFGNPTTGLVSIESVSLSSPGHCQISFSGTSGLPYELQCSGDLRYWRTVASGVLPSGTAVVSDLVDPRGAHFYRVKLTDPVPPPVARAPIR